MVVIQSGHLSGEKLKPIVSSIIRPTVDYPVNAVYGHYVECWDKKGCGKSANLNNEKPEYEQEFLMPESASLLYGLLGFCTGKMYRV